MTTQKRLMAPALLLLLSLGCQPDGTIVDPKVVTDASAPLVASARYSEWSPPVNVGPTVNSPFDDQTPALSPDGLSLYFLSTRPGGLGSADLWVSRRGSPDDPWGVPQNLGPTVNTAFVDAAPYISRDGHQLFFSSNRPGGFGGEPDVWVSWRAHTHDDFAWETPVNVGPPVSSPMFEGGATIHGPEFYFSRGPSGVVPHDIYLSRMRGDAFDAPEVLAELSSAADERRPSIRFDGREIFFLSNRPGGQGLADLWTSTRPGNGAAWSTPVNMGPRINGAFMDIAPSLSDDGTTLVFASNRPGGSGALDLYYTTRSIGGRK